MTVSRDGEWDMGQIFPLSRALLELDTRVGFLAGLLYSSRRGRGGVSCFDQSGVVERAMSYWMLEMEVGMGVRMAWMG